MKKRFVRCLAVLLLILLAIPQTSLGLIEVRRSWRVNVSFNLNGGTWRGPAYKLFSTTLKAYVPDSIDVKQLILAKDEVPEKGGHTFAGWSVKFYDPGDKRVIYDSKDQAWDLNHPFDYYPANPVEMNCDFTALWQPNAPAPQSDVWTVHVTHDLQGGSWSDLHQIFPYTLTAPIGQNMGSESLMMEKMVTPHRAESSFRGWSVLFTDAKSGKIIHDGRSYIWDLNAPFAYYPSNPLEMNCKMIANWKDAQSGGQSGGQPRSRQKLPDGRELTIPFYGDEAHLPETPPPADQYIAGTKWLQSVMIVALNEGERAPVYAFPRWDGPVMDWVGLDDDFEYGLYYADNWVMLYHPKWVASGGIGFVSGDVVAFPGVEEGEP